MCSVKAASDCVFSVPSTQEPINLNSLILKIIPYMETVGNVLYSLDNSADQVTAG